MNKGKHLTLSDRIHISSGLTQNKSFRQIASEINKDPTTISKEVKLHRQRVRSGSIGRIHNSCLHRFTCDHQGLCSRPGCRRSYCRSCSYCNNACSDYIEEICSHLSEPPYVCNGCNQRMKCPLFKSEYNPDIAHKKYLDTLSSSREGCIVSADELDRIDQLILPFIHQGQSIYHIWVNHKDSIMLDSRTLYNYINAGYLKTKRIDLPRAVKYQVRKKSKPLKIDKSCRIGRTKEDFLDYLEEYPDTSYVEMDTVIGRIGGKALLTFSFPQSSFMIAYIRNSNDSKSVITVFNQLYKLLGHDLFTTLFPVILTDNGSEFSNPLALEFADQNQTVRRTRIFYTRPHTPCDKPHIEKTHVEFRKICPKGTSFDDFSQETIQLIFSHVNSHSIRKLNGSTPVKTFSHFFGEHLHSVLGITEIPPDHVILNPKLLKQ